MHRTFYGSIFLIGILFHLAACTSIPVSEEDGDSPHYLSFDDAEALHRFYQYAEGEDLPILVQGHRGTVENDLPESSIASFEYVLERMPAVFEIDPRLTRDSVIIVFHDATLDRTTNGTGKVIDHTWAELQHLRLKNKKGELTEYGIHTLAEVLDWARGKTALVLDKKDVPLEMTAAIIKEHNANNYVMNMVRSTEDALFYYREDPDRMFSASIRTPEMFQAYLDAGIPTTQLFACIGTEINDDTPAFVEMLRKHGVRSLLATASSYDKIEDPEERAEAYRRVAATGVTIIESDYPVELGEVLSSTINKSSIDGERSNTN